jgi:hypothetical protein
MEEGHEMEVVEPGTVAALKTVCVKVKGKVVPVLN